MERKDCVSKSGFLEKYSVGNKFTLRKNWKRRYIASTPNGLLYYKDSDHGKAQGRVPYGFDTTLYTKVDQSVHPEARQHDEYFYFAIQFAETNSKVRMLLLRTQSNAEKAEWCSALSTMMARAD
eukprot:TRINITY_DN9047_c4_g1_i1.p2 TRINITY_DN9047_c4_g1~~TRINITY_DN9047_c4_g1_i1.p2  ORF type:complete len:124 (+),score=15.23 TRINITY_DN9047_c4_g1_i1:66-437(+)